MKYWLLLVPLFLLACGLPTVLPTVEIPIPSATQKPQDAKIVLSATFPVVTITGSVRVRDYDGTDTGQVLLEGTKVEAICDGDYCYILHTLYKVFIGCTDQAHGRGCESE